MHHYHQYPSLLLIHSFSGVSRKCIIITSTCLLSFVFWSIQEMPSPVPKSSPSSFVFRRRGNGSLSPAPKSSLFIHFLSIQEMHHYHQYPSLLHSFSGVSRKCIIITCTPSLLLLSFVFRNECIIITVPKFFSLFIHFLRSRKCIISPVSSSFRFLRSRKWTAITCTQVF
ncbi:hypothetical protein AVEN_275530-1 [Araneus ventricosus]|uniref:Uncharacterized protein n=1 Tax=Araneus ventricosus TaxID=182803 RepID=A0A4Y2XF19_ARAVE|nr:hypothetical protein AVEN_275530-1 [Araneus ventricosus]